MNFTMEISVFVVCIALFSVLVDVLRELRAIRKVLERKP